MGPRVVNGLVWKIKTFDISVSMAGHSFLTTNTISPPPNQNMIQPRLEYTHSLWKSYRGKSVQTQTVCIYVLSRLGVGEQICTYIPKIKMHSIKLIVLSYICMYVINHIYTYSYILYDRRQILLLYSTLLFFERPLTNTLSYILVSMYKYIWDFANWFAKSG